MIQTQKLFLQLKYKKKKKMNESQLFFFFEKIASARVSPEGQSGIGAFLNKSKPSWIQTSSEKKPK